MNKRELAEKFLTKKEKINPFINIPEEEKLIILVDIVGFSKSNTKEQLRKIYFFQSVLKAKIINNKVKMAKPLKISHLIPTGDGCYIIADKCSEESALTFLTSIISEFKNVETEKGTKVSLRASALFGSCIPFMDLSHHKNYIGEGMNEAARILSYGQSKLEEYFLAKNTSASIMDSKLYSRNTLFLGDSLISAAETFRNQAAESFYFNDVEDKHNIKRNITILRDIKEE